MNDPAVLLRSLAPLEVHLEEGIAALVRPVVPDDQERVHRAYELLSEESRMNRFWEKPRELGVSRAESLTDTNESHHVAWIALRPGDDEWPGFAGASFWREMKDPSRAEVAFSVADAWQRKGLATLLFSILWQEGWQLGVRQFFGECRLNNTAMVEWWRGVGGNVKAGSRSCLLDLDLISPAAFLDRVTYGVADSYRAVELAGWMRRWVKLTGASSSGPS